MPTKDPIKLAEKRRRNNATYYAKHSEGQSQQSSQSNDQDFEVEDPFAV